SSVAYSVAPAASTIVNNTAQTTTSYTANLDMENQSVITFVITGKLNAYPPGGTLSVDATIMRPADVTDPDATNPDDLPPTDPMEECNSGTLGCNNFLMHSDVSVGRVNISIGG